ncbi:uncharacterized protein METZ01_LOCUS394898, partial [marine metagenome]
MNFLGIPDAGLVSSAAKPVAQPITTKTASQPVHRVLICQEFTCPNGKLPSKNTARPDIIGGVPEMTEIRDSLSDWTGQFFRFLSDEKDASPYTQRNYQQALDEFMKWNRDTNESPVRWSELERNDFRLFLRQLGRKELSQAAIRLRFSALNSFYKFLMR